jgi:hypothetical protein
MPANPSVHHRADMTRTGSKRASRFAQVWIDLFALNALSPRFFPR